MVAGPALPRNASARHTRFVAAFVTLSMGTGFGFPLAAQSRGLDTGFGVNGFAVTAFEGGTASARAVVVQPDGRIVAAGSANTATTEADFALVRYNPDGSIDPAFGPGANGTVTTDFSGSIDGAEDLKLQADGKIVVVGSAAAATTDFALVRYNPDGTLDEAFGSGGRVTTDFGGGTDIAFAVDLQPDGKIVVAGSGGSSLRGFALARYNADGSLDATFGAGGQVVTGGLLFAKDVVLQADGKIVAIGAVFDSATRTDNFALARYDAGGNLDPAFGAGGLVTTDFVHQGSEFFYNSGNDQASAVAIQPDGAIVVAGSSADIAGTYFAVARYNVDGSLDPSFGDAGKTIIAFGASTDWDIASDAALQPDRKIVVVGTVGVGVLSPSADVGVARLRSRGTPDMSFGDKGQLINDYNSSYNTASAIALQPDDKILVAGGANGNFVVARYLER